MFKNYMKARLAERDTHVVAISAIYTVTRVLVPAEYQMALDSIAAILGAMYVGTPIKTIQK